MQATYYYLVRKYTIKRSGEALVLEVENVFKIAVTYSRVCEFLTSKNWEFQGKDEEMEMDSFRNKKTGEEGVRRGHFGGLSSDLSYGRA